MPPNSAVAALGEVSGAAQLAQARAGEATLQLAGELAGIAPSTSVYESGMNDLLAIIGDPSFPETIDGLLGGAQEHDLVVPLASQTYFVSPAYTSFPAVHAPIGYLFGFNLTPLVSGVYDELHTTSIVNQALCDLGHSASCSAISMPTSGPVSATTLSDPLTDLLSVTLTGNQLDASVVSITTDQTIFPFGKYIASVIGSDTCIPQDTFVLDDANTLQEIVGSSPSASLPAGSESTVKTTWLVICSTGDFVATSIELPVALPTLLALSTNADAYLVHSGDVVLVHVLALYAEGEADVSDSAAFSALGPQTYLGGGAYQATHDGLIFVSVGFQGQSAQVKIQVGEDEIFESGFE